MAVSGHLVYAVAGDGLYRSPLGWNAWTRVSARYVAFLYAAPGGMYHTGMKVLVSGTPGTGSQGQLLWTTDAGRTWSPVRF